MLPTRNAFYTIRKSKVQIKKITKDTSHQHEKKESKSIYTLPYIIEKVSYRARNITTRDFINK